VSGAYIIDSGYMSAGATSQTVAQGIKPYGLVYALVKAKIPVQWIINPNKTSVTSAGKPFDQNKGNDGIDFSFACTGSTSKDYKTGAFIIPKEFASQAAALVTTWRGKGVQVDGPCTNEIPSTLPVYATIKSWPRTVLDAQNGAVAVKYFDNAEIPQGSLTDVNNPPAYRFASPDQLTPCDDMYVMPHADPTYATHKNLINFVKAGGDFYASCHAVSVVENMESVTAGPKVMNFLATNGLVNYDNHVQGNPPYAIYDTYTVSALGALTTLRSGDPIAQFLGRTDAAQQQGSEQIFMTDKARSSVWRPTTQIVIYDPNQLDAVANSKTSNASPATSVVYGPAYGNSSYGQVMYVGGHSSAKGTVDDVAAQRLFFNFQLMASVTGSAVPTDADRTPTVNITTPAPGTLTPGDEVNLSGSAIGGSGNYRYTWSSTCYNGTTKLPSGGTFTSANSSSTSFIAPTSGGVSSCSLTLTVVDTCGRFAFGYQTFTLAPVSDVRISQSVAASAEVGDQLEYTVTVTNNGLTGGTADGAVAGSVSIRSTVPANAIFKSISQQPGAGSCAQNAGVISCEFGDMADEASVTFKFILQPNLLNGASSGTLTNEVNVTTTSLDGVTSNNKDIDNTSITLPAAAQITVEKYPANQRVTSNGVAAFRLTVSNTGNTDLTNISLVDTFSGGGTLVCERGATTYFNTSVSPAYDTITALAIGETWRASCLLSGITGSGSNSFTASGAGLTSKTSTTSTFTMASSISLTKTVNMISRSLAHVVISVFNKTASAVSNITLTDLFPLGTAEKANTASLSSVTYAGAGESTQGIIAYEKFTDYSTGTNYGSLTGSGGSGWKSGSNWSFTASAGASSSSMKISAVSSCSGGGSCSNYKKEGNSLLISAEKSKTYSFTRQVNLKTSNKTVSVLFECMSVDGLTASPKIKVTLGNQQIGNEACDTSRKTKRFTLDVATLSGISATDSAFNLTFATESQTGQSNSNPANVYLDDIHVITGLIAADQFTSTSSNFGLSADWSRSSSSNVYKNQSTSSSTAGTVMVFKQRSSSDRTITNTTSLDPTKFDSASATLSFKMMNLSGSDSVTVYVGGSRVGSITTANDHPCVSGQYCGNGTSTSWSNETMTVPFSGSKEIKIVLNYLSNDGALDDVFLTAAPLGSVDSGGLSGTSLSRVVSALAASSLAAGKEAIVEFDVTVTSPWTGADPRGFVNVATITSSLDPTVPTYAMDYGVIPKPVISIDKTDTETVIASGRRTTYRYTLTNAGADDVTIDGIADPGCAVGTLGRTLKAGSASSGLGLTETLTAGTSWVYTCQTPVLTVDTSTVVSVDYSDLLGGSATEEDQLGIQVLNPAIQVTATPATKTIYKGSDVTYTYKVKNTGNVTLALDSVVGSNCRKDSTSALGAVYLSGDPNMDGMLEVDNEWTYQCRTTGINTSQSSESVTVVASSSSYGVSLTATSSSLAVTVIDKPTISFTKKIVSGSDRLDTLSVGPSNSISYEYRASVDSGTVTNVVINDTGCRVSLPVNITGDTDNDQQLDVGENWIVTCSAGLLSVSETSTASVGAKDGLDNRISSASMSNYVEVLNPELNIEIRPEYLYVLKGKSNKYSYIVKNTGGLPFTSLTVTDSNCPNLQTAFNGRSLGVGATLTITCTVNNLTSDMTSTFYATGVYTGGTIDASPSVVRVFVINPTFQIKKYVKAYTAGTDTNTVLTNGFTDTTTSITADSTNLIFFQYEVKALNGESATAVEGLNSLFLKSFNDPDCIQAAALKDADGFNLGDTNHSGYIDNGEIWKFVCQGVPALTVYRAPGSAPLLKASGKFRMADALPPVSYALKASSPSVGWASVVGDTTTSTVQVGVISSLDDPGSLTPILTLTDSATVTININQPVATTFTLSYSANGGSGSAPADTTQTAGATVTAEAQGSLTRTNFVFGGWNTRPDGSGTTITAGSGTFTMPSGNVTLYAIWTSNVTYSITYNDNGSTGGSVPVDGTAHLSGANVAVKSNSGTLVRDGYTFSGWNTAQGGSGNQYAATGSATLSMPASDVILYAQWTPNEQVAANSTYKIYYDGNGFTGGSVPTDATDYSATNSVTVKANTGSLTRTGYTLTSWNTSANGTGASYSTSGAATLTMGTADVTLYAIWTADVAPNSPTTGGGGSVTPTTFTVTYETSGSNSGSAPTDPKRYQPGEIVTVLPNGGGLSKPGFTFGGWSTAPNGGGTTYGGNGTSIFPMGTGNITLYPIWIANGTLVITYEANGASQGVPPVDANKYKEGSTVVIKSNAGNLYRRGFIFQGWNTAANGSGLAFPASGTATLVLAKTSLNLFAQWKTAPPVRITYNPNGPTSGSAPVDANSYFQLDVAKVLPNSGNLVKAGYKFKGWNTAADGSGTVYPASGAIVIGESNITLYAEWEKDSSSKKGAMTFKVYFAMNSAVVDAVAKKSIKEHLIIAKSKQTSKSQLKITVEGWVQPNNPPGNITYLSTNRAKNVTSVIKSLGIKGQYRLSFPGLAPKNESKSRYAEVVLEWTYSK
jgi:uncharacterized repeat protein (TIGR02543 family)/uncharacterized repeat protein (TIGR01451 family)